MLGIKAKHGDLGYFDIPKCASSTLKNVFLELDYGTDALKNNKKKLTAHEFYQRRKENIDNCEIRLLIIREPIYRFISAYQNRVHIHKELSSQHLENSKISNDRRGIPEPSLKYFIENFEVYNKVDTIKWHTQPICNLIKCDLDYFTHIYKMSQLEECSKLISHLYNKEIIFKKRQTSGPGKPLLSDLSRTHLNKLIEYYRDDYELLNGYFSIDSIIEEWKKDAVIGPVAKLFNIFQRRKKQSKRRRKN